MKMTLRARLRRLWWDLKNPLRGQIRVVEVDPTPEERRAARLAVIPLLAGVAAYAAVHSIVAMFAATIATAILTNLGRRLYVRAGT